MYFRDTRCDFVKSERSKSFFLKTVNLLVLPAPGAVNREIRSRESVPEQGIGFCLAVIVAP